MILIRVEDPEPAVSLAEAKVYLRVSHADEDVLILELVEAAVSYLDAWRGVLGRALMPQVWEMRLCGFPALAIDMPFGPVTAVISIAYRDPQGGEQTIAASDCLFLPRTTGACLLPGEGSSWPASTIGEDSVRVRWAVGTGLTAADRALVLRLVASGYESREAGGPAGFSDDTRALAASRRIWSF